MGFLGALGGGVAASEASKPAPASAAGGGTGSVFTGGGTGGQQGLTGSTLEKALKKEGLRKEEGKTKKPSGSQFFKDALFSQLLN